MANLHNEFLSFFNELRIPISKIERLIKSRNNLRKKIRKYFLENHEDYHPTFWIQGSYKMKTTIRTKDDTCDIDDGVYFDSNPDNVSCYTLQSWVKEAVNETTDDISHRKKCITVNYKADYNIDLPVYLFDKNKDEHPSLAVKNSDWREDDPKEMVDIFKNHLDEKRQLRRIVCYLKAWCDHKRDKMPSGLALSILAMNNFQSHERDDVSLKFTLIEIENSLNLNFRCKVPATPHDDIFEDYSETRKNNFLNNLSAFIKDAKEATDEEKNHYKASVLWRKHLGNRFPLAEDINEKETKASSLNSIIGTSKPYYDR